MKRTPRPPERLDAIAAAKWQELAPLLPNWEPASLDSLEVYCTHWARWQAAEQQIAALGPVVKSAAGFAVENPWLAVSRRALAETRRAAQALGLHKQRRPTPAPKDNPILGIIGRKQA